MSFTLDRYGHLFPEADTTVAGRLDALINAARPRGTAGTKRSTPKSTRAKRGPKLSLGASQHAKSVR